MSGPLAHGIVKDFIEAMLVFYQHLIKFPTGDALKQVIKGFESKRQMPNCVGGIVCSHILISTPAIQDQKVYHDRNHTTSVVLQGVVDSVGRFNDIWAGYPGACNDMKLLLIPLLLLVSMTPTGCLSLWLRLMGSMSSPI